MKKGIKLICKIVLVILNLVILSSCAYNTSSSSNTSSGVDLTNMYIPKDARIAIIYSQDVTSQVENTSYNSYDSKQQQKDSEQATYRGFQREINYLLRNGYYIIDRDYINSILKEQKLGVSGFVNPHTAAKIGNLTGATHLLVVKYKTYYFLKCAGFFLSGRQWHSYDADYKLIECSTGRLVSSYHTSN